MEQPRLLKGSQYRGFVLAFGLSVLVNMEKVSCDCSWAQAMHLSHELIDCKKHSNQESSITSGMANSAVVNIPD